MQPDENGNCRNDQGRLVNVPKGKHCHDNGNAFHGAPKSN